MTHSLHCLNMKSHSKVERKHARTANGLGIEIQQPRLLEFIRRFLYDQVYPGGFLFGTDVSISECPNFTGNLNVHYSAAATFFAPSDPSGVGGMHREHIRASPSWFKGSSRFDCAFVRQQGLHALQTQPDIVRILLLFSFKFSGAFYHCALVRFFEYISDEVDEDTGMYIVRPSKASDMQFPVLVISLDLIIRAAHLIPVFGTANVPRELNNSQSLDAFQYFYVNKYVDHHAFELLD